MNLLGHGMFEAYMLICLVAILLLGGTLHVMYLKTIESKVRRTEDSDFDFEDLMRSMYVSQGSNFNIMMILSWNLLFVALAFLYLLTPSIFPEWNYFKIPRVASWDWGFAIFGTAALIPGAMISIFVPKVYSYHQIHKRLKGIAAAIPALLLGSIICSIHLGTIYPASDPFFWNLGYLMLAAAAVLMIAPISIGFLEVRRN